MGAKTYAKGSYAIGECQRSGKKMPLKDLVADGRYPWMLVAPEWKEDPHPQERLKPKVDPTTLRRAAPRQEALGLPRTPILTLVGGYFRDQFNRADGAMGAPWSTATLPNTSTPGMTIAGQVIVAPVRASPPYAAAVNLGAYGFERDMRLKVTIPTAPSASSGDIRLYAAANAAFTNLYQATASGNGPQWAIARVVNGVGTTLTSSFQSISNGDTFELIVRGNDISILRNGAVIVTATDSRVDGGPWAALGMNFGSAVSADDFIARRITPDCAGVRLTWTESSAPLYGVDVYQVYRSVDGAAFALLGQVNVTRDALGIRTNELRYEDANVDLGTHDYAYRVVAVPLSGALSLPSNTVTIA